VTRKWYLDFDGFISIVAHVMKAEELDQQVEQDFLTMCGVDNREIAYNRENLLKSRNIRITADDILHHCRSNEFILDKQIAEEMVYDASESGNGSVGLNDLITTIETVFKDESVNSNLQTSAFDLLKIHISKS